MFSLRWNDIWTVVCFSVAMYGLFFEGDLIPSPMLLQQLMEQL